MLTKKKLLLASSLLMLTTANFSIANDAVSSDTDSSAAKSSDAVSAKTVNVNVPKGSAPEGSLKLVMQGLLKDTQALTSAMLNEDFALIAIQANNIADHPKPSMETRKKLMKAMGSDMAKFKANDNIVHGAAVEIMKSAKQKNIQGVGENFKKMIGGCLSCHSAFKNRVSAILK